MGLTKAQLALRRTGIGASESPALLGATGFAGPIDVYASKVMGETKEETLQMFLGNELEGPLTKLYERERPGFTLVEPDTFRHAQHAIILATPDRLAYPGKVNRRKPPPLAQVERLVQFKTTGWREQKNYGPAGTDEVPDDKVIQVTQEMGVTGIPVCDLAVLFERNAFEIYTLRFDAELFEGITEVCLKFWMDHVVPRRPPPPDASDRYREFLGKLYPTHKEGKELLAPTEDVLKLVAAWDELDARISEDTDRLKLVKNMLREFIKDAPGIATPQYRIDFKKNQDSRKVDWEALARDIHTTFALVAAAAGEEVLGDLKARPLNDLIEQFTTTTPGNRPLCKRAWPKPKGSKKKALPEGQKALPEGTP